MKIPPPKQGDRFGRLVVLERIKKEKKHWHIKCRCDCGTEKTILQQHVIDGTTQSCGCFRHDRLVNLNLKHGDKRRNTPCVEYRTWCQMIQRCTNPNYIGYSDYGGRGIRVCEAWRSSYESFLASVGRRPTDQHSIERLNNSGNYEPGNVKWATVTEQSNNRRSNHFIEWNGRRQTISQWSRETGINKNTLWKRINSGWPVERILV